MVQNQIFTQLTEMQKKVYLVTQTENKNRQWRQKTRQTGVKRNERNIPLSEGFEICFCLIVSEREKIRRRESTDRDSEK